MCMRSVSACGGGDRAGANARACSGDVAEGVWVLHPPSPWAASAPQVKASGPRNVTRQCLIIFLL